MNSLWESLLSFLSNLTEHTHQFRDRAIIEAKLLAARINVALRGNLLEQLRQLPEPPDPRPIDSSTTHRPNYPEEFREALRQGIDREEAFITDWKSELESTKQKLKAHKRKRESR